MKRFVGSFVFLSILAISLSACGSKAPATGTGPAGGGETAKPVLPDVPFEQLDHQQQIQFMKEVVVPTMAPIFQKHDAEEFKNFGCKTCHGESADRGEFHMPNDKLPKLNFADMSKWKPADLEWMKTEVVPTMAKLLKEELYSPETQKGFGCLECHTQVQ
jgi:hypothetical protein